LRGSFAGGRQYKPLAIEREAFICFGISETAGSVPIWLRFLCGWTKGRVWPPNPQVRGWRHLSVRRLGMRDVNLNGPLANVNPNLLRDGNLFGGNSAGWCRAAMLHAQPGLLRTRKHLAPVLSYLPITGTRPRTSSKTQTQPVSFGLADGPRHTPPNGPLAIFGFHSVRGNTATQGK